MCCCVNLDQMEVICNLRKKNLKRNFSVKIPKKWFEFNIGKGAHVEKKMRGYKACVVRASLEDKENSYFI